MQRSSFIGNAPERPDITFQVVGLVFPDFRGGVVGCAGLRVDEASFGHLGDIQVPQFNGAIGVEEDICALDVSVEDPSVMESFEALGHLDKNRPYLGLREIAFCFLALRDFVEQIPSASVFQYNT
jgi:hypothetical protein